MKTSTKLYDNKEYDKAVNIFSSLGNYEDSDKMVNECKYGSAVLLYDNGDFKKARDKFLLLKNYKDSGTYAEDAKWEMLAEKYPYTDNEDDANVYFSDNPNLKNLKIMIWTTKEKDGITLQYISDNTADGGVKSTITTTVYRDSDDATAISSDFFPNRSSKDVYCADYKPSQYIDEANDKLNWVDPSHTSS